MNKNKKRWRDGVQKMELKLGSQQICTVVAGNHVALLLDASRRP